MNRTRRHGAGRLWAGSTTQRVPTLAQREPAPLETATKAPRHSLPSPPQLTVGSRLLAGRLEVRGLLGEGGMGVVYEAFDAERAELVAVKTLAYVDATEIYRLKNEFRAIADVLHRNLVRLYELFVDDGHWYFSMELVAGRRFDRWVRPHAQLDEARLRAALPQLRDGVQAIHAAGKLHRDLKPSNVLVTAEGRVVVLDFGLVVEPDLGGPGHTLDERRVAGTPAYMAPEQAAAEPEAPSCDFYAIGVMLFEALAGRLPFPSHGLDVLLSKQQRDAPPVAELAPDAPEDLAQLCDQLLARVPEQRPDSAVLRVALGSASAATLPPRASFGALAPVELIGREPERAALRAAYRAMCDGGKPVVMLVAGESGIGKSTLIDGFLAELTVEGDALVLSGRCYEREAVPYKGLDAVIDALSRFLRRCDDRELARILPRDVWALRRLFPVLARIEAIADVPERDMPDAQELRQRAFHALGELLVAIRAQQPLVIHIDDLQWSDGDSTALLLHLLRRPDAPRLLFIGAHRDEPAAEHPVLRPLYELLPNDIRLDVRPLALGPLSAAAALELAQRHAAPDAVALAREAGGNPFLLGELARCAPELAGAGGAGVSLHSALRARVQRLPERERSLLEVLAVAARPLRLELAAQAAGIDGGRAAMAGLREAQLGRSAGHEGSVECYHDRIREAVVAGLPPASLRSHHRALADALARRSESDPEHLFAHYELAGERALAAQHALSAAARATASLAFERAVGFYDRALALGSFGRAEVQRLELARAEALSHAGRGPEAAEAYLQARERAAQEQRPELQRRAAEQFLMSGHLERGHALLADALAALEVKLPRTPVKALGSLLYLRTRLRLRGLQLNDTPRPAADPAVARKLEALLASGSALSRTDALYAAEASARHLTLALQAGGDVDVARSLVWEVLFASVLGAPPARVREVAAVAERMCKRTGDVEARAALHRHFGFFLYSNVEPDLPAALRELDASVALYREHALPTSSYDRPWGEWNRAVVRGYLCHFSELARELPAQLDDAWARADLCIAPMWAAQVLPRLAVEDLQGAERDLARARAAWSAPGFTLQDLSLIQGAYHVGLYRGDAQGVWERIERELARIGKSPLERGSPLAAALHGLRAGTAAALAGQTRDRKQRAALCKEIERGAAALRRSARGNWTAKLAEPLAALLAYLHGDEQAAVTRLRAAIRALAAIPVLREICRRKLGGLVGGDEGRALCAQADGFLSSRGVVDPARFASAVMPGFEQR